LLKFDEHGELLEIIKGTGANRETGTISFNNTQLNPSYYNGDVNSDS